MRKRHESGKQEQHARNTGTHGRVTSVASIGQTLAPVARALHLHTGNTSARITHTMKLYRNAEKA